MYCMHAKINQLGFTADAGNNVTRVPAIFLHLCNCNVACGIQIELRARCPCEKPLRLEQESELPNCMLII